MLSPYPRDGRTPSGGVEAVAMYLATGLKDLRGSDLHVLTCDIEARRPVVTYKGGIPVHVIPSSRYLRRITWYAWERRSIQRELHRLQPDIVHVQGTDMYGAAGVSAGFPNVVTVHGIARREARITNPAATALQRLHQLMRGIGNSAFERYTLKRSIDIISISPYVENSIMHLTRARIHFIPNPVGDRFFDITGPGIEGRVLFVGRLDPKKRVQDLLCAINRVRRNWPQVELHIAGSASYDESYTRMLADYVATEGLATHVKFLGWVSQEALLDEYARCALAVLCSEEESSPLAIQQAMAAGKPVVASRAAGVPWLVEDQATGLLFDTGDVEALAESILCLLKVPPRRQEMGRTARTRALDQFAPSRVAAQTQSVYEQVLTEQPKA